MGIFQEGFILCLTTVQIQIEKGIAPKVTHKIHTVWSILTNDNSAGNTCDLVVFLSISLYWSSVLPATTTTTPHFHHQLSLSHFHFARLSSRLCVSGSTKRTATKQRSPVTGAYRDEWERYSGERERGKKGKGGCWLAEKMSEIRGQRVSVRERC